MTADSPCEPSIMKDSAWVHRIKSRKRQDTV
jgi:hypothetical protein